MALQTDYSFCGMIIPNAYIRIEGINWSYQDGMSASVSVYADKEASAVTSFRADGLMVDNIGGQSIIGVIYTALKQSPEFASAVDV